MDIKNQYDVIPNPYQLQQFSSARPVSSGNHSELPGSLSWSVPSPARCLSEMRECLVQPHHHTKAAGCLLPSAGPAPGAPRLSCPAEPRPGPRSPHTLPLPLACPFFSRSPRQAEPARPQPLRAGGRSLGARPGPQTPPLGRK